MTKPEKIVSKYVDKLILPSDPLAPMWNKENEVFEKNPKWNYIDNCMITAILMLYDLTGDQKLLDYSKEFINAYVSEDGSILSLNYADYNLDNINGARNLFTLWRITDEERYRLGFERFWTEQLVRHPRLDCGSFWHKGIYPDQIWLDGSYMALPFLIQYGTLRKSRGIVDDAIRQLWDMRRILRDPDTGLFHHGYDDTNTMCWADRITGLSPEFWLRSNGWMCAALADCCELLPESDLLKTELSDLIADMSKYCMKDGMLLQLPTRPELKNNYPETSGSLLFAYAALKAARLGICGDDTRKAGQLTFETVTEKYIDDSGDVPILKNICLVGGLGGENNRDGSAEYYLSEKIVENDAKGIAPYIMAYTELKRLP
jgi:unsaturated rhamnogalacturonyl hydrolase